MTDRTFIDTNIWVYAVDGAEPDKQARAKEVLEPSADKDFVVSAQVLGEFFTAVTGKLAKSVPAAEGRSMVERMSGLPVVPIDVQLVNEAIADSQDWNISYWDALILVAARSAGCRVVLSEDLAHETMYGSVQVQNPFRVDSAAADKPKESRG